ncbi:MAG: nucleotide exchange factor GrpE [Alphaproteobacteria bacterium]
MYRRRNGKELIKMTQETPKKTNAEDAEKTLDSALDQDGNQLSECASEEVDQLKDQLLRALAEAENTRKRALREQEEGRKYAITSFAKDVLSVLDNLGRALDSIPEDTASESTLLENLLNGITMTQQALSTVCERHGIQKIEALGVKFDPHHHQAMCEIEGKEEDVGCVVQVMQEGYQIHGRLLRPALVGVGKALTVIES